MWHRRSREVEINKLKKLFIYRLLHGYHRPPSPTADLPGWGSQRSSLKAQAAGKEGGPRLGVVRHRGRPAWSSSGGRTGVLKSGGLVVSSVFTRSGHQLKPLRTLDEQGGRQCSLTRASALYGTSRLRWPHRKQQQSKHSVRMWGKNS